MSGPDLLKTVLAYRDGDQDAGSNLLKTVLALADEKCAEFAKLSSDDACDAALHVMNKLASSAFDPKKCTGNQAVLVWIKRAIHNFLISRHRSRTLGLVKGTDLVSGDDELWDPPAPLKEDDRASQRKLARLAESLLQLHQRVVELLSNRTQKVNYAAVYLWRFRMQWYNKLRRQSANTPDWCSVVELLEEFTRWAPEQSQAQFRPDWPTLEELWAEIRPNIMDGKLLDAGMLQSAVRKLRPELNPTAAQFYQWFCRLERMLEELIDTEELPGPGVSQDAFQCWKTMLMSRCKAS